MWICSRAVTNRHKAGQGPHLLGIAHRGRSIPDGLCSIVSLKENILVVLRVHASISTKLTWKRLGRRMDVPALPQPCLAMPICPRTALGTSCSAVPGVLAWGLLSLLQFSASPPGSWPMALFRDQSARGRTKYTSLTFTCQMSGVLSVSWPGTSSSVLHIHL